MMDRYLSVLKTYWGYDSFRPLQAEIVQSVAEGNDTLALMPTGGGKSLTFQVPTMAQEGMCLVITPLIALMKDQVQNLQARGIKATAIYSGMQQREIEQWLDNCVYGDYKFLYLSPERLCTDLFLRRWPYMNVCLIAVDESHCISQWGYDFRPSYLKIAEIRKQKPDVPVLALTATATPEVAKDIQEKLLFRRPCVFQKSFYRSNLSYVVRHTEDKQGLMLDILKKVPGSSVVYVRNRKRTREVAEILCGNGISAEFFHAGLGNWEKDERQARWKTGETRVIVATNAFGMGIDKPDVRSVIHLDLPDSIEAYFQEAGRAGRDEKQAYAVLLCNKGDEVNLKKRITDNFPSKDYVREVYDHVCMYYQIALGSGCEQVFPFDLQAFCAQYKLSLFQAYSALQLLQLAGVIEVTDEQDSSSRIVFSITRDELYNIRLSEQEERVVQVLLRSYTGLFFDLVMIDEDAIAHRASCNHRQLCETLISLSRRHIIRYVPRRVTPYIIFTTQRLRSDLLVLNASVYDERKKRYEEKIQAMLGYAFETDECRSRYLLSYFGEKDSADCGHCDVCRAKNKKEATVDVRKQACAQVENLLRQESADLHALVAATGMPESEALQLLRQLQDDGKIRLNAEMRYEWVG